jgi:hypothetical protein
MERKPKQIMENGVLFNLWCSATSVELLEVGQPPRALSCDDDGWYQGFSPTVPAAATSSRSTASSLFLTLLPIFSPTKRPATASAHIAKGNILNYGNPHEALPEFDAAARPSL